MIFFVVVVGGRQLKKKKKVGLKILRLSRNLRFLVSIKLIFLTLKKDHILKT